MVLATALVVMGAATPAAAAGGPLAGPFAGKSYASFAPKIGANGTVVVYSSWLRNFDSGAQPFDAGVYYRNRSNGTTVPVVVPISGARPNGTSRPLAVSSDPSTTHVLYQSLASNLVSGDNAGHADVFAFNRLTSTTERVSVSDGEQQGNGPSTNGAISGNGRFVAFSSNATNLVSPATNGKAQIFVRDRQAGTTKLVSIGLGGAAADGDAFGVSISDDGRFIAFASIATNLTAGDTNASADVFVRDTQTATTELVSQGHLGPVTGASVSPNLSADGRFVSFESDGDDVVPGDENFATDVFVRDRLFGSVERVSVGPNGEEGFGESLNPTMSRDGRFVAFESDAEEFDTNDGNISYDIYVRDRVGRTIQRASERQNGFEAFADSSDASMSPDGRHVGFVSDTDEFCNGCDSNDDYDVYVKDMGASFVGNTNLGAKYRSVTPRRVLDTSGGAKLAAGATVDVQTAGGASTVPASATAVLLNVVSSGQTVADAVVTAYPTGTAKPATAALHSQVGIGVSNQIVVKTGSGGNVRFTTDKGATHLTVDVVGYFAPDDGHLFTSTVTGNILDTRSSLVPTGWPAGVPLASGGSRGRLDLPVAGTDDVPANASAVALNITVIGATAANARLTAFATGGPNPGISSAVTPAGALVTTTPTVPVGAGGRVSLTISAGTAHVLVSVAGYYGPFGRDAFFPLAPARSFDTRATSGALAVPGRTGPLAAVSTAVVPLLSRAGVPANGRDVVAAVSATPAQTGALIVYPTSAATTLRTNLAYRSGSAVTNTNFLGVGPDDGSVVLFNYSLASVHVFADVYGYFR